MDGCAMARRLDGRARELARIHVLKKDLALDDEQYRTVLWVVGRVESSADLDDHGRKQVIAHLQAHVDQARKPRSYPGRPHNADAADRREMKKIEALLADAGKPWAYAAAMARRMFGKERLAWCSRGELAAILTALEKQALKRLRSELEADLGPDWVGLSSEFAMLGLSFNSKQRSIEHYSETMSQVRRWWRGELEISCDWPVSPTRPGKCCFWCRRRSA
jgi:phage gp16-like protein